jgi:hypothetical protein
MLETLMMINGSSVLIVVVHLLVCNSCASAVWNAVVAGWSRLYNMCRVIVIYLRQICFQQIGIELLFPCRKNNRLFMLIIENT